ASSHRLSRSGFSFARLCRRLRCRAALGVDPETEAIPPVTPSDALPELGRRVAAAVAAAARDALRAAWARDRPSAAEAGVAAASPGVRARVWRIAAEPSRPPGFSFRESVTAASERT